MHQLRNIADVINQPPLFGQNFNIPKERDFSNYLSTTCKKYLSKSALVYDKQTVTFSFLLDKINQTANFFVENAIKEKMRVALLAEPSIDYLIIILSLLKLGVTFIPIEGSYPKARIEYMLENCQADYVIIDDIVLRDQFDIPTITLETIKKDREKHAITFLNNLVDHKTIAYILYTSGTTGLPKGIMISHGALLNHMLWMKHALLMDNNDVILFKTPVSFDPAIWEMLLPFFIGATLIIAPPAAYIDPCKIVKLVQDHNVTCIQFVPALLQEFLNQFSINECTSLKYVFSGGDNLTKKTKRLFFSKLPNTKLFNLYGPAEATIDIAYHEIKQGAFDFDSNIIGRPIYNTELYVLDENQEPLKAGEIGELYIASASLATGYINNNKETEQRFIVNPFSKKTYPTLYRTGDFVKIINEKLEYIGREDNLFKIKGARIAPDEIANRILLSPDVDQCVVIKCLDNKKNPYLKACLVPKSQVAIDIKQIKKTLNQFLPFYMCPKKYVVLTELPKTINGKIDIKALASYQEIKTYAKIIKLTDNNLDYIENKIKSIWQSVLQIEAISENDNFFDLGGSSLQAIHLVNELQDNLNIQLQLNDIFLYPTYNELVEYIKDIVKKASEQLNTTGNDSMLNNNLVTLRKGSGIPLFLIHPIGGSVFWYRALSQTKFANRSIYAIQDPGLNYGEKYFTSIEDMAKSYYYLVKAKQPTGPYFVGGASFGATVALEVAKLLINNNDIVLLVPILDGWAFYPNELNDPHYFHSSMQRQYNAMLLAQMNKQAQIPETILDLQKHRLLLLNQYKFKEIEAKFILFKATEVLPIFQTIEEPTNYWQKFTKTKVDVIKVNGNHETMFQKPYVNELATELFKILDRTEQTVTA